jgi:hypothetical protein
MAAQMVLSGTDSQTKLLNLEREKVKSERSTSYYNDKIHQRQILSGKLRTYVRSAPLWAPPLAFGSIHNISGPCPRIAMFYIPNKQRLHDIIIATIEIHLTFLIGHQHKI